MKIAVIDLLAKSGFTGHTRTAVATAKALRARGHDVIFLMRPQANTRLVEGASFEVIRIVQNWTGQFSRLDEQLYSLKHDCGLDLVHSFDFGGAADIVAACKKLKIPCFFTQCADQPYKRLIKVRPLIVVSQEWKVFLVQSEGWDAEDIIVVPARIDTEVLSLDADANQLASLKEKHNLPVDSKVILRVARVSPQYVTSIVQGIEATARLRMQGLNVSFVHIGIRQDRWSSKYIDRCIEEANKKCKATVAVSTQEGTANAPDYISAADLVIGAGRGAFDAMLRAKPVLIVGENGFAGTVTSTRVEELAYRNFSGRNASSERTAEESISELADEIERLITDNVYYSEVATFGQQYVLNKLDVRFGAAQYEQIYQKYVKDMRFTADEEIQKHRVSPATYWRHRIIPESTRARILKLVRR